VPIGNKLVKDINVIATGLSGLMLRTVISSPLNFHLIKSSNQLCDKNCVRVKRKNEVGYGLEVGGGARNKIMNRYTGGATPLLTWYGT